MFFRQKLDPTPVQIMTDTRIYDLIMFEIFFGCLLNERKNDPFTQHFRIQPLQRK